MAKSSKKQCRKPRLPKQGGGLVVVSAHDMKRLYGSRPTAPKAQNCKGKAQMAKNVIRDPEGFGMDETSGASHALKGHTGSNAQQFLFNSSTERSERLYYLLQVQSKPRVPEERKATVLREAGCHALVFVATISSAQELLAQLKALSLTAFAVHERTPKAQAQDCMRRFSSESSQERAAVLMMTNGAVVRPPSLGVLRVTGDGILRVVHFDAPRDARTRAARERVVQVVCAGRDPGLVDHIFLESDDAEGLEPFPFNSSAMDAIRSRLAVTKKLARAQAVTASRRKDSSDMERAAAAAGLEWDTDGTQNEVATQASACERRRGLAQQTIALREKLRVLLCQPLLQRFSSKTGGEGGSSTPDVKQRTSPKETRKKMIILGMITGSDETQPDERCRAQSRWLDGAIAREFGGDWECTVRTGASCDSASRAIRSLVEAAKLAYPEESTKAKARKRKAMRRWNPKPDTPDDERWGGRWGKPCGHNEVVLQHVRPFAPIEVLNTRVCSRASPAPGNHGFDGCMEYLSLSCWAHRRALTIWDIGAFHFIDPTGTPSTLDKHEMLQLPLAMLQFMVKNMRSFTICCDGKRSPRELARSVLYCAGWGAKQSQFAPLDTALSARIMSFVLSGDRATWKSILRLPDGDLAKVSAEEAERRSNVKLVFSSKRRRFNL